MSSLLVTDFEHNQRYWLYTALLFRRNSISLKQSQPVCVDYVFVGTGGTKLVRLICLALAIVSKANADFEACVVFL